MLIPGRSCSLSPRFPGSRRRSLSNILKKDGRADFDIPLRLACHFVAHFIDPGHPHTFDKVLDKVGDEVDGGSEQVVNKFFRFFCRDELTRRRLAGLIRAFAAERISRREIRRLDTGQGGRDQTSYALKPSPARPAKHHQVACL